MEQIVAWIDIGISLAAWFSLGWLIGRGQRFRREEVLRLAADDGISLAEQVGGPGPEKLTRAAAWVEGAARRMRIEVTPAEARALVEIRLHHLKKTGAA